MIGRLFKAVFNWLVRWRHPLAGLIVLSIGLFGHIIPLQDDLDRMNRRLAAYQHELEKKQTRATQLPTYLSQLQEIEQRLAQQSRQLPAKPDLDGLLNSLFDSSHASGSKLQQFVPQAIEQREFYSQQVVRIVLEGDYTSLSRFADALAQQEQISLWNKLRIHPAEHKARLKLEGELLTFGYIEEG